MYFGDHDPPHFHASYAGEDALVEIATGTVLRGFLPRRARRLVTEWLEEHRAELEGNWLRAQRHEPPFPVDPLT
jgi:hypothetical protein